MRKCLMLLLLATATTTFAQDYDADSVLYTPLAKPLRKKVKVISVQETSKAVEYFFNVQMGNLIGCNDCGKGKDVTFSAATTHGVTVGKKFRAGLGVGFDSYINWQTIPVFTMASWDLIGNKNKNAIYLQLTYGWAHPWFIRNGQYSIYTTDPFAAVSGGRMINPTIGYRIRYHDLKLSFGVGYKFQRIFYKTAPYYYCADCAASEKTEITEDFNRFQMIMSVGWK